MYNSTYFFVRRIMCISSTFTYTEKGHRTGFSYYGALPTAVDSNSPDIMVQNVCIGVVLSVFCELCVSVCGNRLCGFISVSSVPLYLVESGFFVIIVEGREEGAFAQTFPAERLRESFSSVFLLLLSLSGQSFPFPPLGEGDGGGGGEKGEEEGEKKKTCVKEDLPIITNTRTCV